MSLPPPSNPRAALEAVAIRYLSFRPRFRVEVENRLAKKAQELGLADPLTLINQIIKSLEKSGFLDDAKNLESFIRYRLMTKMKGPLWLRAKLRVLGVARSAVDTALRQIATREAQLEVIRRFLAKKSPRRRPDLKTKARLFRALVSRGFPASLVASAFDGKDLGEV